MECLGLGFSELHIAGRRFVFVARCTNALVGTFIQNGQYAVGGDFSNCRIFW